MNTLIAVMMVGIAGYVTWRRRLTWWMMHHDRVLTLGITLQTIGFALCMPLTGRYLGAPLFYLTGVAYLRDYLGHLCFFSSIGCVIYAAVCRLLPDTEVRLWIRRRVEIPGAVAAAIMLIALISSTSKQKLSIGGDFFIVPCDAWLNAYWITLAAHCINLKLTAMQALRILRTDPRSRDVANLLTMASVAGILVIVCVLISTVGHKAGAASYAWALLAVSGTLYSVGAKESWARRTRFLREGQPEPAI